MRDHEAAPPDGGIVEEEMISFMSPGRATRAMTSKIKNFITGHEDDEERQSKRAVKRALEEEDYFEDEDEDFDAFSVSDDDEDDDDYYDRSTHAKNEMALQRSLIPHIQPYQNKTIKIMIDPRLMFMNITVIHIFIHSLIVNRYQ
jgi:translation elongation factor P/translation initiation factor 5A